MKPKIKKRWVEALRGGQYQQAQHRLSDGVGFCCLGVLCNLHALETGTSWERDGHIYYLNERTALPDEVVKWAGLHDDNPNVREGTLGQHNDGDHLCGITRKDFSVIAMLIEECL